jgi:hypothetical protein
MKERQDAILVMQMARRKGTARSVQLPITREQVCPSLDA